MEIFVSRSQIAAAIPGRYFDNHHAFARRQPSHFIKRPAIQALQVSKSKQDMTGTLFSIARAVQREPKAKQRQHFTQRNQLRYRVGNDIRPTVIRTGSVGLQHVLSYVRVLNNELVLPLLCPFTLENIYGSTARTCQAL